MITTDGGVSPPGSEQDLPPDLVKAIREYLEGLESHSPLLDCLWGELYGSINANQWGGVISPETAGMLRRKYLFSEDGDDGSNRLFRLR